MHSFYQSVLWRTIQETIYKKPLFEVQLGKQSYRGIIKQMRVLGQTKRWSMIHGISLSPEHFDEQFHTDLLARKRDHGKYDLFLQLGFVHQIAEWQTKRDTVPERLDRSLEYVYRDFLTWYDLRPTVREHMPQATIILDTQGTVAERKSACSDSGKRMLNKGQKAGLTFEMIKNTEQWSAFWHLRYTTSYDKGFSIIPEDHFLALMTMLTETKQGWLFVAKKDDVIVSGSVCLAFEEQIIYLYGATDRAFGAIGAHYRLTQEIRVRARDHEYSSFDLLGIAPPRSEETHYLGGVTRFKQSFGGKTIVSAGSYDLVCSHRGYQAFKARRRLKT